MLFDQKQWPTRHGFKTKSNLLFIRGRLRLESTQLLWYKSPECNVGRISDINWIPITGKPKKCSDKPRGDFAAK